MRCLNGYHQWTFFSSSELQCVYCKIVKYKEEVAKEKKHISSSKKSNPPKSKKSIAPEDSKNIFFIQTRTTKNYKRKHL